MSDQTGNYLNWAMSMLLKKIIVPSSYHDRVEAVGEMLEDDVSGIVGTLTDFSVQSADVDFSIETGDDKFTQKLKNWLDNINRGYNGKIPRGIRALAQEYYKERWSSSSFPILKIVEWETWEGIKVPSKMFFVDGGSVYAEEKETNKKTKTLIGYDYYLTKEDKDPLNKGVIITNPYGRWFDEYPNPYLIKRGVYHNWKIIQLLKNKQTEILDQIIPYLLLIKKGFKGTTLDESKSYSNEELKAVVEQFRTLIKEIKSANLGDTSVGTPTRATNFDEDIEHLIPDLKVIFQAELFTVAERNILSGLGFVDIAEAISTSRRESILNPKAFIQEVRTGVKDFETAILTELVYRIIDENKSARKKYVNSEIYIAHTPITIFQTDEFKNQMRLLWERGQLSNQTYCELVGEVRFRTEVLRREKEAKDGLEYTMYPHIRENKEGVGIDIPGKDTDVNGNPIPTDKLDDPEKYNVGKNQAFVKCPKCKKIFDMLAEKEAGMGWVKCPKCGEAVTQKDLVKSKKVLETAPYTKITDLPDSVRKKLSPAKQRAWMSIFNNAYKFYLEKFGDAKKAETLAFRTAWEKIKQVKAKKKTKKNKNK